MKRILPLLLVVAVAAACGSKPVTIYSLAKTKACLAGKTVRLGAATDFVASTATGGAVRAHVPGAPVTIVFGQTIDDANNIDDAYQRFHAANVGINDVLFQVQNVVMLWQVHPTDTQRALVEGCLR